MEGPMQVRREISYQSLLEPVYRRAEEAPDETVLHLVEQIDCSTEISAGKFSRDMLAGAAVLRAAGIQKGDVVVLVLRQSWELVAAMFASMALGAVPSIFTYMSPKLNVASYLQRVRQLVGRADARLVITLSDYVSDMKNALSGLHCQTMSITEVTAGGVEPLSMDELPVAEPDDIALLQYSSGTTGMKKGVVFTHRKIIEHIRDICHPQFFGITADDVMVCWLPLHHDMGLIAHLICSVVARIKLILMAPLRWMRNPILLLQVIERYNGSITFMPNFAYSHMIRTVRARDVEGLQLKSLRILGSGGEPAQEQTIRDFYEHFKSCGVRRDMFSVGYGMAESVAGISCTPITDAPRVDWIDRITMQNERRAVPVTPDSDDAQSVVSCGLFLPSIEAKIVDDEGRELGAREIGELLVRSHYVFDGYYRQPEKTMHALRDGWLHTGDYGYMADGELYVCGRKKDMMIIGGKNVFPGDLETVANRIEGVQPGRAVAFGILDEVKQTEAAVLVCEVRTKRSEDEKNRMINELRQSVGDVLDIALFDVRLVDRGWIVKSSSGKMARSMNREKYFAQFGRSSDGR